MAARNVYDGWSGDGTRRRRFLICNTSSEYTGACSVATYTALVALSVVFIKQARGTPLLPGIGNTSAYGTHSSSRRSSEKTGRGPVLFDSIVVRKVAVARPISNGWSVLDAKWRRDHWGVQTQCGFESLLGPVHGRPGRGRIQMTIPLSKTRVGKEASAVRFHVSLWAIGSSPSKPRVPCSLCYRVSGSSTAA